MKKIFLTAAIAIMTICANAELKNASGNALINEVKTANEAVKSISCKFTQTKNMAFISSPTTKEGNFNYTKPDKLSMKYADGEAVIINEGNVTLGMNGKVRNVKAQNKRVESLASTLLSCMSGKIAELDGTLTSAEKKGNYVTFKIKVEFTVGKGDITDLELQYDVKDKTLKTMKMIEADGSYTLYELQTKTLNSKISDDVYTLKK